VSAWGRDLYLLPVDMYSKYIDYST
jgi:hypothetical protein